MLRAAQTQDAADVIDENEDEIEEDDDLDMDEHDTDDDEQALPWPRRRSRKRVRHPWPEVPSMTGRELMESGKFGTNQREAYLNTNALETKKKIGMRLLRRELGLGPYAKHQSAKGLASQVSHLQRSPV